MRLKFTSVILFILFGLSSQAQYIKSPGFAKLSAGYGYYQPMLYNGASTPAPWQGIHFRSNWLEFNFFMGEVNAEFLNNGDPDYGVAYNFGWNMPIAGLGFGERGVGISGFRVQPIIGVHAGWLNIGGDNMFSPRISPGIHVQLPYGLVALRLNTGWTFAKKEDREKPFALAGNGFQFAPELTFQLDGLYDVLDPEVKYSGTSVHISKWSEYESEDIGGGWVRITRTDYQQTRFVDWYARDVRPFFAIAPKYELGTQGNRGSTFIGANFSGRATAFMFDIGLDAGEVNFSNPSIDSIDFEPNQFDGSYKATRISLGVGVDWLFSLQSIFFPRSVAQGKGFTRMSRFYVGIRGGYILPGNATYSRSEAGAEMDNLAATYAMENPADLDAREIKPSWTLTPFASAEFGALSVYTQITAGTKLGGTGAHTTVGISYLLPYNRILKRYRELR